MEMIQWKNLTNEQFKPNPDGKITRNIQIKPNSKDPVESKERFKQLNYQKLKRKEEEKKQLGSAQHHYKYNSLFECFEKKHLMETNYSNINKRWRKEKQTQKA